MDELIAEAEAQSGGDGLSQKQIDDLIAKAKAKKKSGDPDKKKKGTGDFPWLVVIGAGIAATGQIPIGLGIAGLGILTAAGKGKA